MSKYERERATKIIVDILTTNKTSVQGDGESVLMHWMGNMPFGFKLALQDGEKCGLVTDLEVISNYDKYDTIRVEFKMSQELRTALEYALL